MATFTTTAKHALRWLTGTNAVLDIDAGFQALAEDLDAIIAIADKGVAGSRPTSSPGTPGKSGRFYYATDTLVVSFDYGTGWVDLVSRPLAVAQTDLVAAVQQALFAPGDVKASAIAAAPTGWLLCDGNAVSRATYAALFAAIGTAYGVGNGTTTFNVPDLQGRGAIGKGTNVSVDALGDSDGVLLINRKPQHNHQIDGSEMNTGATGEIGSADRPASADSPGRSGGYQFNWGAVTDGPTNGPAYLVVNWFVKT